MSLTLKELIAKDTEQEERLKEIRQLALIREREQQPEKQPEKQPKKQPEKQKQSNPEEETNSRINPLTWIRKFLPKGKGSNSSVVSTEESNNPKLWLYENHYLTLIASYKGMQVHEARAVELYLCRPELRPDEINKTINDSFYLNPELYLPLVHKEDISKIPDFIQPIDILKILERYNIQEKPLDYSHNRRKYDLKPNEDYYKATFAMTKKDRFPVRDQIELLAIQIGLFENESLLKKYDSKPEDNKSEDNKFEGIKSEDNKSEEERVYSTQKTNDYILEIISDLSQLELQRVYDTFIISQTKDICDELELINRISTDLMPPEEESKELEQDSLVNPESYEEDYQKDIFPSPMNRFIIKEYLSTSPDRMSIKQLRSEFGDIYSVLDFYEIRQKDENGMFSIRPAIPELNVPTKDSDSSDSDSSYNLENRIEDHIQKAIQEMSEKGQIESNDFLAELLEKEITDYTVEELKQIYNLPTKTANALYLSLSLDKSPEDILRITGIDILPLKTLYALREKIITSSNISSSEQPNQEIEPTSLQEKLDDKIIEKFPESSPDNPLDNSSETILLDKKDIVSDIPAKTEISSSYVSKFKKRVSSGLLGIGVAIILAGGFGSYLAGAKADETLLRYNLESKKYEAVLNKIEGIEAEISSREDKVNYLKSQITQYRGSDIQEQMNYRRKEVLLNDKIFDLNQEIAEFERIKKPFEENNDVSRIKDLSEESDRLRSYSSYAKSAFNIGLGLASIGTLGLGLLYLRSRKDRD